VVARRGDGEVGVAVVRRGDAEPLAGVGMRESVSPKFRDN
jgi:hypothetical protein